VKLLNSSQLFLETRILCLSCILLAASQSWAADLDAENSGINPPINAQADETPLDEIYAIAQTASVQMEPIHIGNALVLNQVGEVIGSTRREPLDGSANTPLSSANSIITGPPDEQTYMSLLEDIGRYEEMLQAGEELRGVWDPSLSEDLMAMGRMLQEQGDFNRALEIFTRAAQINRINYGLISIEQIAPIESMVETYIALNQWQEADRQQRYAFYVQTRAFAHNDPRLIPALDKLAQWNVLTFRQGAEGEPLRKLLEAYRLYNAAAALVNVHFGFSDPRYVEYLKNMTQTAFRLAMYGTQSQLDRVSIRNQNIMVGPDVRTISNGSVNTVTRVNGFSEGERALRDIYELYSSPRMRNLEGVELRRAEALAEIGDWYIVFNRRQAAFRIYRDVYDILSELGPSEADQFFEQLVVLPGFMMEEEIGLNLTDGSGQPLRQGYADVSLGINQYGRATNVQLLAVEPADALRASAAVVRTARGTNFRPRLEGRETVDVKEARLRFPFWY